MADIISGKSRFNGQEKQTDSGKVIRLRSPEEEKDTLDEQYVKEKIKRHRRNVLVGCLITAAAVFILVLAALFLLDGRTYSQYTVLHSVNRDDTESAKYEAFADGYIRYSNDGAAYYNAKGIAEWNQTFSMQNPHIKVCGEWAAVGDVNGSTIYMFGVQGMVGSVDTSLSISQIEVAKQGIVAAVLEDTTANYINLYNTDGSKIYTVKTTLAGDGYPLDISISEDATKLIASYLYVSGESIKTNVVFYNFSEVGQNETERVVGGFNHYDSTINYLKNISQPIDLLTRNDAVKHLEDRGDYDTNVTTVQDALIASVKVTNGAERAYFSTVTGHLITGWTEWDNTKNKLGNKKSIQDGVNNTAKDWYKSTIGSPARNSVYAQFTDPYTDSQGNTVITVSQEIKYSDNSNYGAVAMDINFEEMTN